MTQKSTFLLGFGLHAGAHGDDPDWRGFWSGLVDQLDGAAEFLTLEDRFADPGQDGLDAILLANWLAPRSRNIGIIAGAPLNFVEPFHVSTAIATLDYVSEGRAGLLAQRLDQQQSVEAGRAIGALNGFPAVDQPSLDRDALAAVDVVRRLWDSWEDDAIIRDVASQRYVDGEKLHYIDFLSADFRVLGPSITPRPPQGQPVVAVSWAVEADLALARAADVVFVPVEGDLAGMVATLQSNGPGTGPKVIADLHIRPNRADATELVAAVRTSAAQGAHGVRLILPAPHRQIAHVIDTLVPFLRADVLIGPPLGGNLRSRLGLPAVRNRYAAAA
ncbi:LLM class flavin-dependent oxidoreductase [Bosea lathyri]|uniref:Flavin-dependent oxidoreductase, luciferase family (Includes alkanesulfonate monooxygenase SsuD and methylene tetrahydromethanopterin reductase) n=1 Tax=Bosea lathyri TaxID=1036778 RepID=A0A1H6DAE4_9HYPH|nr:LLM class flavin-dependent oxidoreductase [Bosea lathyri]SEG81803.1 Flavin-dependent oxidoreductase, luciferase family (includes alkanesulfonate monooxygenase SsuD and methylene tetrahydromethanopterin reductase) [Bosea lathyri]